MKILNVVLLAVCVLCAVSAFGQATAGTAVLSSQPQIFRSPSHPEHASGKPMAVEQPLAGGGTYTAAKGERPLWEVAPKVDETPLGDTARDVRRERLSARKAKRVWEN